MLMKPSQTGADSTGSRFLRSVHLETDLPDADSLQGYRITSGTRTVQARLSPDVVQLEWQDVELLRHLTVFAAATRPIPDLLTA